MKSILLLSATLSVNSAMVPMRRFVLFLEKMFPYRFLAAKVTRVPLMREIVNNMLFKQTNLTVLPKESVVEINLERTIKSPDSMVLPSQVVEYSFVNKIPIDHEFLHMSCG